DVVPPSKPDRRRRCTGCRATVGPDDADAARPRRHTGRAGGGGRFPRQRRCLVRDRSRSHRRRRTLAQPPIRPARRPLRLRPHRDGRLTMASISLRGVEKRYGSELVLRDCNLDIDDHEFMVLVGPSGSGKTTLLRIIAGLEPLSGGEVYFDDVRVNEVDVGDRDIAMVFQNYGLYPHMNVYDNMAFGLKRRGLPKDQIDEQVRRTAQLLGIEPMLRRRPKQRSGGQRQRVALGRAIVRDPAVFLLDEPLSNLDAHLRVQMRAEILKVHRAVTATAVYVTHDQVEAL